MAVLRHVPKTFSFEEQRIEINEIAQDLFDLSSANANLTVDQGTAGTASLSYDSATGILSYTPPDLSAFITSFTETDPIFTASAASGITSGNITNWNTAYGWGDHSAAGYLTTIPAHTHDLEDLGDVNITGADAPSDGEALVWNQSAGKWKAQQLLIVNVNQFSVDNTGTAGNGAGHLDYNQSTGLFTFSPATIPTIPTDVSAFNNDANYLTSLPSHSINDHSDVDTTGAAQGKTLRYNGTNWVISQDVSYSQAILGDFSSVQWDLTPTIDGGAGIADSITITAGDNITFSSVTGSGFTIDAADGVVNINDLGDVDTTGLVAGKILKSNASGNWVVADDDTGTSINALNDIGDVNVGGTITDGHVLKWDNTNSEWVAGPDLTTSGGSGIALTDISVIKPNPAASGSGDVTYSSTSGAFTYTPPELKLSNLTDVDTAGANTGKIIKFNGVNNTWEVSDDTGGIALTDISVVKPNPSASGSGDVTYDNTTGEFTYTPPSIPAAQVKSDWDSSTGLSEILNKPTSLSEFTNDLTTAFISLTDTPNTLQGDKWLKVNSGGTALEFTDAPGGGTASSDPIGTIVIWSGASNAIPTGYQLCDGSASATTELQAIRANVPDLRDKFVIGADNNYNVNSTGGSADAIVVSHSHSSGNLGSNSTGAHNHNVSASGSAATDSRNVYTSYLGDIPSGGTSYLGDSGGGSSSGDKGLHAHDFSVQVSGNTGNNGSHSHNITGNTSSEGSSGTGANLPPYYALCYIIKNAATSSGGGGGASTSPGGSNTQLQWNNNGSFGGTPKVTWDNTNNDIVFEGTSVSNTLRWDSSASALRLESSSVEMQFVGDAQHVHTIEQSGDYLMVGAKGTGAKLYLDATSTIKFITAGDAANVLLEATDDGPVNLYYAYGKKFETTQDGVKVTGGIEDKDGNLGTAGQILSSTGTELDWIDNKFTTLLDTPSSLTADKWLKVNSGGTALEFTDAPSGGGGTDTDTTYEIKALDNNDDINIQIDASGSGTDSSVKIKAGNNITLDHINAGEFEISATGEANVQSDWNQSNTTSPDYIKNRPTLVTSINDLDDVDTTGAADTKILKHNGTQWVVADDDSGSGATTIDGLTDTNLNTSNLGSGQVLQHDGSKWVNADAPGGVPSGTIVMFNSATAPSGWALCDGNNNTPDLRDKFIVGAGNSYNQGSTGGSKDAVVISHSHGAGNLGTSNTGSHSHTSGNFGTNNTGSHSHNQSGSGSGSGTTGNQSHNHYHTTSTTVNTGSDGAHQHRWGTDDLIGSQGGNNNPDASGGSDWRAWTDSQGAHSHTFNFTHDTLGVSQNHTHDFNFNYNIGGSTGNDGSHSHNVSGNTNNTGSHSHNVTGNTASEGSGGSDKNLPPYYALTYIMKL